jgi:PAP2 superfamily protein
MADGNVLEDLIWGLLAALAVAVTAGFLLLGLTLEWTSAAKPVLGSSGLALLGLYYRHRRGEKRIGASLVVLAQLVAFTALGGLLSYQLGAFNRPLWDDTFFAWDRALGLDWRSYLAFVNDHPWLGTLYTLAYQSLFPQTALVIVALGLGGQLAKLRIFLTAIVVSGLVAIVISGAMPAFAMFVHLNLQFADFANLNPAAAFVHVAPLKGLREGTLTTLSLDGMEGIITFPSYHVALAVVLGWALWQVSWLRWSGVIVNGLVIAATPIDGGHYFVDVFAGAIIAALSIAAARSLAMRSAQGGRMLVQRA